MIAASLMLEKLQMDEEVDVFEAVKRARIPRPEMVTSPVRHTIKTNVQLKQGLYPVGNYLL